MAEMPPFGPRGIHGIRRGRRAAGKPPKEDAKPRPEAKAAQNRPGLKPGRQRRTCPGACQPLEGQANILPEVAEESQECPHSALSAFTGSRRDARSAGYTPKRMPTPAPRPRASRIDQSVTRAGSGDTKAI